MFPSKQTIPVRQVPIICSYGPFGYGAVSTTDDIPVVEPEPLEEKCVCKMDVLMARGCQCGQFQREMAKKRQEKSEQWDSTWG